MKLKHSYNIIEMKHWFYSTGNILAEGWSWWGSQKEKFRFFPTLQHKQIESLIPQILCRFLSDPLRFLRSWTSVHSPWSSSQIRSWNGSWFSVSLTRRWSGSSWFSGSRSLSLVLSSFMELLKFLAQLVVLSRRLEFRFLSLWCSLTWRCFH